MKKKLAAVLAGVMVLTMGMATVFALGSSETTDEGYDAVSGLVSETDTVDAVGAGEATVTDNGDDTYTIVVDEADAETLGLVDGETYYIYVDGVAVEAVYTEGVGFVVSADDVTLEDGDVITVEVYTVTSEEESEEPSEGSEEPSEGSEEPSEGTGSETAGTADSGSSSTTSGGSTTSDKTGAAAALPILAVAALAGVVVCGKKVKFYE